jgi:hypothetical protein
MANMLERTAVLFVSHSMSQIHRICNKVLVLDQGMITFLGQDVSVGVQEYYSLVGSVEASAAGSGDVVADRFAVLVNGRPPQTDVPDIVSGSCVEFKFRLKSQTGVKACRVGMVIWNSEMYPIADVISENGRSHCVEFGEKGHAEYVLAIRELNLAAGRYSLSLHIMHQTDSHTFNRIDNAMWILVRGPLHGGGGCLLKSVISIAADDDAREISGMQNWS